MSLEQGAQINELTFRSILDPDLVVVAQKRFPQLLQKKATGGSYSKCKVGRLVGQSINPTLKDINISFNYLLYYLISMGGSRVVTKVYLVTKPSGRRSSA